MFNLELPDDHLKLEMIIAEERMLLSFEENYNFIKDGFDFIPFIASRHYRTYPFPNSWRNKLNTRFCFNKTDKVKEFELTVPVLSP